MLKLKHLTTIFISMTGVALVLPVFANSEWTKVTMSEDKNAFYVDIASIKGNERTRNYKDLIIFGQSTNLKSTLPGNRIIRDNSVDCQNYTYRTYKSLWLDKNGDKLKINPEPEIKKYRPEATYRPVLDLVCSQSQASLSQPIYMGKDYLEVLSSSSSSCYMETSDNRIINLMSMCTSSSKSFGDGSRAASNNEMFSKPREYSGRVLGGAETPSRFNSWYCASNCKGSGNSSTPGASASSGSGSSAGSGPCANPGDLASDGSLCGKRAASEKEGGN